MLKKSALIGLTMLIAFPTAVLAPAVAMARSSESPELQSFRSSAHAQLRKAGLKVVGPQTSMKNAMKAAFIESMVNGEGNGAVQSAAYNQAMQAEVQEFQNVQKSK
jgi:hypothetical protein